MTRNVQETSVKLWYFHKDTLFQSMTAVCKVLIKRWFHFEKQPPSLDTLGVGCPRVYSHHDSEHLLFAAGRNGHGVLVNSTIVYIPAETRSNVRVYTLEWTQKCLTQKRNASTRAGLGLNGKVHYFFLIMNLKLKLDMWSGWIYVTSRCF